MTTWNMPAEAAGSRCLDGADGIAVPSAGLSGTGTERRRSSRITGTENLSERENTSSLTSVRARGAAGML